jgi:shikimate kinase
MNVPERSLFLVGFMGSGKSRVGAALARELDWPFVDNDARVEAREGRKIAEIFEARGEPYFRRVEGESLRSLDLSCPTVIATGGGAFLNPGMRRWMKREGCTLWLDVPLEIARRRLGSGAGRPLWPARDRVEQRVLFERRRAAYALAEARIVAAPGSPTSIAKAILRKGTCG